MMNKGPGRAALARRAAPGPHSRRVRHGRQDQRQARLTLRSKMARLRTHSAQERRFHWSAKGKTIPRQPTQSDTETGQF